MRGFTLLEILVMLNVLALTALLGFAVYALSLRAQVLSALTVRAQGVAARGLESVLAHPCDWITPTAPPEIIRDEGVPFERHVDVQVLRGTDLWRIDVRVRWVTFSRSHETALVYHHAFYGLVCPQWLSPYRP